MGTEKDTEFRKLSIDSFFNFEADHIDIAFKQVKIIHNSGDIYSSGNQFENAVREFFKIKLPNKYYVSNGHIIDKYLNTSPQLDLIIADNFKTPVLYTTLDKSEYLTYESIYCYAEIKSSWNKKHITDFILTRERMQQFLERENVSPNFIDTGGKGIELDIETTTNSSKNPLFTFMFIGNSDNFTFGQIKEIYNKTDWKFLPNIICLFDKGIIVNINKKCLDNKTFKVNIYPEFIENKSENQWVLLSYDKKRSSLGTLYYIILEHLNTCVLGYPNMLDYMQQIFEIKSENIDPLNNY
jgi:hypothetical protein